MARSKAAAIPDEMLDQFLSGADASTAFNHGGLLDHLKKALAERALNAEMDHHLASEGGAEMSPDPNVFALEVRTLIKWGSNQGKCRPR